VPGAKRTILFYIHFDGQPIDRARWKQSDPFTQCFATAASKAVARSSPTLPRSANSPRVAYLCTRCRRRQRPHRSIRFCTRRSRRQAHEQHQTHSGRREEGGGAGLRSALRAHQDRLQSDVIVFLDGPQHPTGRPPFTMARGAELAWKLSSTQPRAECTAETTATGF